MPARDHIPMLMPADVVAEELCVSESTVWRLAKEGAIPAPLTLGKKSKRWSRAALERWIDNLEKGVTDDDPVPMPL